MTENELKPTHTLATRNICPVCNDELPAHRPSCSEAGEAGETGKAGEMKASSGRPSATPMPPASPSFDSESGEANGDTPVETPKRRGR